MQDIGKLFLYDILYTFCAIAHNVPAVGDGLAARIRKYAAFPAHEVDVLPARFGQDAAGIDMLHVSHLALNVEKRPGIFPKIHI
jgi:hypothetical protein